MASSEGRAGGHDKTALDEIELAGELMIAASDSREERLATERIDEVLLDREQPPGGCGPGRAGLNGPGLPRPGLHGPGPGGEEG
ncbi:hypothetical protein [Kitasatospora camelliae]|uniref:Uncharacterized protein n=1 Tax=Kitasatospora camelliae TaxID=3156397 RepID=A0AAU8K005_9ACTN